MLCGSYPPLSFGIGRHTFYLNCLYFRVGKEFPEEYSFVPKTWILPSDYSQLINYGKDLKSRKKTKTFIVKPANGAQGHG